MYIFSALYVLWLHVIILTSRMLSIMGKWEQACGDSVESSFKLLFLTVLRTDSVCGA